MAENKEKSPLEPPVRAAESPENRSGDRAAPIPPFSISSFARRFKRLFGKTGSRRKPSVSSVPRFDAVRVAEASGRGFGVFATEQFEAGRAVGKIVGKIKSADYRSDYCVGFGDAVLEPASPYRFLNHSCDPNCQLIEWKIAVPNAETAKNGGEIAKIAEEIDETTISELWLHALREVAPGEELTIDYGWGAEAAVPCRCGSSNCRGWICRESELDVARQMKKRDGRSDVDADSSRRFESRNENYF